MNMRLCALLETSDGEYHICRGQFSSFRPWSLLLSTLKLRSRSLSAMMDLNAQPCKLRTYGLCLQVSEYRTGARFRAKIFQLPVGRPTGILPLSLNSASSTSGRAGWSVLSELVSSVII